MQGGQGEWANCPLGCKKSTQPRPCWPPSRPFPTAKADLRGHPQEVSSARRLVGLEALASVRSGERARPGDTALWAGLHLKPRYRKMSLLKAFQGEVFHRRLCSPVNVLPFV